MHELGIMYNIVNLVERHKTENKLEKVCKIVLQIGEIASVVPRYIEECYLPAIDGTSLEDCVLEIEIVPAVGKCRDCNKTFNLAEGKGSCTSCKSKEYELITGKEFLVKEIHGM